METYLINGIEFSSKAAIKSTVQDMFERYPSGQALNPDDMDFAYDLLCMHEHAAEKIGTGIASIGVRIDPVYKKHKQFVIFRKDGSSTDFSYLKCLRYPTHRAQFIQACRQAVASGIIAFGKQFFKAHSQAVCPFTGEILTPQNAHVDHVHPQTFRGLLEKFLHSTHLDIDAVELVSGGDNSCTIQIKDKLIESAWIEYHWKYAKLRVISASANLALGDRAEDTPQPWYHSEALEAGRVKWRAELEAMGYVRSAAAEREAREGEAS